VSGDDVMAMSITTLRTFRAAMDKTYGPAADASIEMEVGGDHTLADVLAFVRDGLSCLAT
jgi:CRISPR system Cascade subunit CasC